MAVHYKDLPEALQKQLAGQLGVSAAKKAAPKGIGGKFLRTFAGNLLKQAILLPIVSALSIASMWIFHGLMKLAGPEGWKAIKWISKTYHTDPSEWGSWVSSYIENITGKPLDVEKLAAGGARVLSDGVVKQFSTDIMNELLALIVPEGPITEQKGMDAAAGYLSVNMQFQMSAWLLHMIGDVQSFGMFKSLKDLPNAISWSFGLGWLSWLVMGTPFQTAIVQPLKWKFERELRSARMSEGQAHEALRRGEIDSRAWHDLMATKGWRDRDATLIYKLSEKDFADSMIRDAHFHGMLTRPQVLGELLKKGFSLTRAESVVNFWEYERKYDLMEKIYKEYEDLYTDDRVSRGELATIAKEITHDSVEVDMKLDIADLKKIKARSLTKADISRALSDKQIGIAQARTKLLGAGFSARDTDLLIRMWTKAKPPVEVEVEVPEVRLLSRAELERAFKEKVIGPTDFIVGLRALGYSDKDAQIILQSITVEVVVEEEEEAVAEVIEKEEKERELTKSELVKAFVDAIIDKIQFIQGLKDLNYSDSAITIIVETAERVKEKARLKALEIAEARRISEELAAQVEIIEVLTPEKELGKGELKTAYLRGVLTIQQMQARVAELGYSTIAIDITTELVEKQRLEIEERKLPEEAISLRKESQVLYTTKVIDTEKLIELLTDAGYTEEVIRIVIKYAHEST